MAVIPQDAVVTSVDPVVSHLSQRQTIYQFPAPFPDTRPLGSPEGSAEVKAAVGYMIVLNRNLEMAAANGFTEVVLRSGRFTVLTRPAGQ